MDVGAEGMGGEVAAPAGLGAWLPPVCAAGGCVKPKPAGSSAVVDAASCTLCSHEP